MGSRWIGWGPPVRRQGPPPAPAPTTTTSGGFEQVMADAEERQRPVDGRHPGVHPEDHFRRRSARSGQQSAAGRVSRAGRPAVTPPRIGPEGEPRLHAAGRDDVLLLTDLIEEPKSAVVPPPIPLAAHRSGAAAEMPQPSIEPPGLPIGRAGRRRRSPAVRPRPSPASTRPSRRACRRRPPPDPGPALGNGGKTVEELVKETLRPMLKEWLDQNLPQTVERYVEREIVRLTRR